MNQRIFPILLMVLYVSAAVVYGLHKDYRRMCYWLSACAINLSVTL